MDCPTSLLLGDDGEDSKSAMQSRDKAHARENPPAPCSPPTPVTGGGLRGERPRSPRVKGVSTASAGAEPRSDCNKGHAGGAQRRLHMTNSRRRGAAEAARDQLTPEGRSAGCTRDNQTRGLALAASRRCLAHARARPPSTRFRRSRRPRARLLAARSGPRPPRPHEEREMPLRRPERSWAAAPFAVPPTRPPGRRAP